MVEKRRILRILQMLTLAAVVVSFYSSCHLMVRTICYDDQRNHYYDADMRTYFSSYATYSTKGAIATMVHRGRVQWNMMLVAMLAWIGTTIALKYQRSHPQVNSPAEDYRDGQIT
jgi:hypothetical protein